MEIKKEFLGHLSCEKDKYSSCKLLLYLLSPVILDVKPAMTISLKKDCERVLKNILSTNKRIEYEYLYNSYDKSIILVYNKNNLKRDLEESGNYMLLEKFGYNRNQTLEEKINILKKRYLESDFPHEIGAFLGIPFNDILGFMENKKCLYTGYWKVYYDLEMAKEKFNLYDKAKEVIAESFKEGKSIYETMEIKNLENLKTFMKQ